MPHPVAMEKRPNKEQKLRQLKILQTLRTFMHSHSCSNARCGEANCEEMKASLVHFKECSRKPRRNCFVCRQVLALTRYHAKHYKDCESNFCVVPFCPKIKIKLKENEQKKLDNEIIVIDDDKEYAVDTGEIVIKQEKEDCPDEVNYEPIPTTSQFYETPGNPIVALKSQLLESIIELMDIAKDSNSGPWNFEADRQRNLELLQNIYDPYRQMMNFHSSNPEAELAALSKDFTQEWQSALNPNSRVQLLRTLNNICFTVVPDNRTDLRDEIKVATSKLEKLLFENANSKKEYENLIATILGKVSSARF